MTSRALRKLDLRAPEVIQQEAAANRAWSTYFSAQQYNERWLPAKISIGMRQPLGETPYQSYARLSLTNHTRAKPYTPTSYFAMWLHPDGETAKLNLWHRFLRWIAWG